MRSESVVHVVDDDEAVRESMAFLLRSAQIEVEVYESATAFLGKASDGAAGCVVTDVRMPEMTGIELVRRLKDLRIDLPVIVMTGHGDVPLAVEAMKAGAVDFIEKPFDDDVILTAVRAALVRGEAPRQISLGERGRFLLDYIELLRRERTGEAEGFRHVAPGPGVENRSPDATAVVARGHDRWVINKLRALNSWYTKGLDNGSHLRVSVNAAESIPHLRDIIAEFFGAAKLAEAAK